MDYPSENGDSYYSPAPPPEQVAEQEQAIAKTVAALPILKELIEDLEKFYEEAKSIHGISVAGEVETKAQIIAKTEIEYWCKDRLAHYRALYDSVRPSQEGK
ncbi:MAG TPA: hypothetical protein VJ841_03550 [Candidatus Saccharimonadales bacterium]|nr:hypothetical protein [Candidatus Saccharimonadales bacterium]